MAAKRKRKVPARPKKTQTPAALPVEPPERARPVVVGVGASAGGIEALQRFFQQMPTDSGLAFVVVQHRDPAHKGMLAEILQRSTPMPVMEAAEGVRVEPNQVYVNPSNLDVVLADGTLHLAEPVAPRGLGLPIDLFLRSLAAHRAEEGIGVILSGMGSDGTLGLRAIKEQAGATFVQSPESSKFDGMPRSAIEAQVADVVATDAELPAKIVAVAQRLRRTNRRAEEHADALELFLLLRTMKGNDFSLYKTSTILRRVERRMGIHQLDTIRDYARLLRENPHEVDLLFKELLIGVTSFFRDPSAWDALKDKVIVPLVRRRRGGVIRAWVVGCSTGEEAYTLAILIKEVIEQVQGVQNLRVQIFATDLDKEAVDKARTGIYPANIAADVSPERLRRYFSQDEHGFRVSKEIREMVIFAPQNVVADAPFTKVDIISCRNLLIYFAQDLQKKLIPLFHYALNPGGVLFLGNAETAGSYASLFSAEDTRARLFRRVEPVEAPAVDFPAAVAARMPQHIEPRDVDDKPQPRGAQPNVQTLVERFMVDRFAPAGILTGPKGDILYISGRTGDFLEPPAGRANWNLLAMAREGLRYELAGAFSAALRGTRVVIVRGVAVKNNGNTVTTDIIAQKLTDPEALRGKVLVVFKPALPAPSTAEAKARHKKGIRAIEIELQRSRSENQALREQMQTSEEELKSTNEELQSTNEELQSTNEELTTSKEELQSLNEELQTVNHELQSKVDELSRSNNDMTNLLNSTDVATLFLDGELRVRRFTVQTAKLIKLILGDAGRPITDITMSIDYPDLADDAREVLRTLVFRDRLVATVQEGEQRRWFSVRILPYRTIENVIDGVVITFTDATAQKKLETKLRETASQLRQLADSMPNLVWGAQPSGVCDYLNAQWLAYTGIPESEQLGYRWLEQVSDADREKLRKQWSAALKSGQVLEAEARIRGASGGEHWFKIHATPIRDEAGKITRWYGSCVDIDDLKR